MSDRLSKRELLDRAVQLHEEIRTWRRTIHRYPELTFDEHRTGALVSATLIDLDIKTETEVARTGVVGHIHGGDGPTVGLRADMDALPITEASGVDFASTRPGIMHACGHDSHTAMLLGAAAILKGLADEGRLPGNVRLLFQPSEEAQDDEGKSGGKRMVEEGALDGLDAVFGLHVDPTRDAGTVSTMAGPMLAAADRFTLVIHGSGGHAARPQGAVDPIALAGIFITCVQQIVSRRLDPLDAGVLTIGTINGGTINNVIPDSVEMRGTIRSFTPEARALLHDELRKTCSVVEPFGGRFDLTIFPGYPATVNSLEATEIMIAATGEMLGEEKVVQGVPVMGAEDFSYMAQAAPGCFLRVGVHDPAWGNDYFLLHRADFKLDEDALPVGSASLAAAAIEWMELKR